MPAYENGDGRPVPQMDGAMFQFIVEEKSGLGKEKTQRVLRRVKAVFSERDNGDKRSKKAHGGENKGV